jgi:hypothetical protein
MEIVNFGSLTTPEKFTNYYYTQLKELLESENLELSKVGVLGYLLHIIGNLQYDTKKYYDLLFNESFPISCLDNTNLHQHSLTYGFPFELATPATLLGTIQFNFDNLPSKLENTKREITIDNIDNNIQFNIDGLNFILLSKYVITISENDFYSVQVIDKNNTPYILPLRESITDLVNCEQINIELYDEYNIPNYSFGTYYTIEIQLDNLTTSISDISIQVMENNSVDWVDYSTTNNKAFLNNHTQITSSTECIFYKIVDRIDSRYLILETGSGNHGKYIPSAKLKITLTLTQGEKGNIGKNDITQGVTGNVMIVDIPSNSESPIINYVSAQEFISFNIANGISGKDILFGENLRQSLIEFIQTRDNLINELDFKNILKKYFKYFEFLFKKINLQTNTVGLYINLVDRYLNPELTTTKSILLPDFETAANTFEIDGSTYIYYPTVMLDGEQFVSPFIYQYNSFLNFYKAYFCLDEKVYSLSEYAASSETSYLIQLKVSLDVNTSDAKLSTKFDILEISSPDNTKYDIRYLLNIPILSIVDQVFVEIIDSTPGSDLILYSFEYNGLFSTLVACSITLQTKDKTTPTVPWKTVTKFEFRSINIVIDLLDSIQLRKYLINNNEYIIDVPLIHNANFQADRDFYLNQLFTGFSSFEIQENRLITDDIQYKFLNTCLVEQPYISQLVVANSNRYTYNLHLPLKIKIDLILDKDVILVNNINIYNFINDLKLIMGTYLITLNSTKVKFYKTIVIEMCHTFKWVKHVKVTLTDSDSIPNELYDSNIEVIDQKDLLPKLSKTEIINYNPILFWFDSNNVAINYTFL